MDNSGDQVFGDNIDKILSEKIIEHTEMSEKTCQNNEKNYEKKNISTILSISLLLIISTITFCIIQKSYSTIFTKK